MSLVDYGINAEEILNGEYGLRLEGEDDWLRGKCPIHDGEGKNFRVNKSDGGYHCFSRGCKGDFWNLLGFLRGTDWREAKNFYLDGVKTEIRSIENKITSLSDITPGKIKEIKREQINFVSLPDIAYDYLYKRGLTDWTINKYGIKYCKYSLYNDSDLWYWENRIVVPFRDENNNLITWLGRSIGKGTKDDLKVVYLPDTNASDTLFNIQQAKKKREVTIVEGWLDALILQQWGYNSVSINKCDISLKQLMQVMNFFKKINVCFDYDDAGVKGAKKVIDKLKYFATEIYYLDLGMFGIDNLDPAELKQEQASELYLKRYRQ